jgi:putative redox protein
MTVHSQTEAAGAFRQVIQVNAHTLHSDLVEASGGQGSAPGPHDFYDISLATCKALTACVYAKSRKYALDRVEVVVERDDSREREGVYVLKVKMEYFGALTAEEKQKMHDAMTRCPIHKLMTSVKTEIETAPLSG